MLVYDRKNTSSICNTNLCTFPHKEKKIWIVTSLIVVWTQLLVVALTLEEGFFNNKKL